MPLTRMPLPRRTPRVSQPPVSVYLLDSDDAIRNSLWRLLDRVEGFVPVGQSYSVEEGLAEIAMSEPDVVVVASRLDDGHGLDVCRSVRTGLLHTHLVMFSSAEELRTDAVQAGACSFASKSQPVSQLLNLVRSTAHGQAYGCRARQPKQPMRAIRQSA